MRPGFEVVGSYGNGHAVSPGTVRAHSGGHTVGKGQKNFVCLIEGNYIFFQCGGYAVALGFLALTLDRGGVNAVGIVMDLFAQFDAYKPLYPFQIRIRQISEGADAGFFQCFGVLRTHWEQIPHIQ